MHFLERKGFPEDAQKDGEQDIATKTPTVHSNNPPTPNEFAKQLFLLIHNSNGILQRYFISNSFFFLSFTSISSSHERIINCEILEGALNRERIEDEARFFSHR